MNKHHDELSQRFQLLMDVRNEIKQSLDITRSVSSNGKQVPCLIEIDKWEREMIQRIQQIAAKARTNANELMMKHMNEISDRFEQISVNMQQQEKEGGYLENDIERVKKQLDQLKNDIKHVNEKIQVDSTISNNIEWETLIYIVEDELPNKATSKLVQTRDKVKLKKKVFTPMSFPTEQSAASKQYSYMFTMYVFLILEASGSNSIPVQVIEPSSSSNNQNSTIHEQRRVPLNKCLMCDQLFDDFRSTRICPTCRY
jgi:hypothetical protein